jgi:hypothetical protein
VFVLVDKIGWFGKRLDESLWVEPFQKFYVPVFSRVDKAIDSLVKKKGNSEEFCILRKR